MTNELRPKLRQWTEDERAAAQNFTDAASAGFPKVDITRARDIEAIARIGEVRDKHEAELLALEGVVGVAPMRKIIKWKLSDEYSLTILVEQKQPKTRVAKEQLVPDEIDGVKTDVIEVGRIEALTFNWRVRPAMPGYSIGHYNITAGTFGCLVHDIRRCCCRLEKDCGCTSTRQDCPGDYLILSNNHVLANSNDAKPGDLILQPGPYDYGEFPSDGIATLDRFEPIVFGYSGYNLVDAAVAQPTYSRHVIPAIIGLVIPQGVAQVFDGDYVIKVGRTSQVTYGYVWSTDATVAVWYGYDKVAVYRHQIITTNMAEGGDSGSLLMDYRLNAVGLLFAGSWYITIHNPIADVETALGVRPVTAPWAGGMF